MEGLFAPLGPRTLHICVDMQRLFSSEGPWATPWMEGVLPNVCRLAERVADKTVFTRFIPPEHPDELPGMWRRYFRRWREVTLSTLDPRLLELVPALARLVPPARIVDKSFYSAFARSELDRHLAEREADTLVFTGAETDVCVLATVLGAVDRGYRVILATDALCSSSDVGHDALLTLYRTRFSEQIETARVEEVLEEWR
jgi:nicotinamidase-related amidase